MTKCLINKKSYTKKNFASVDWNHLVMISDINVSATFSITVNEDYYNQLSSVMWIGELMKVFRLAENNIAEWVLVEQWKVWVLWVTVSFGYVCYSKGLRSCKESFQKGIKLYTIWGQGKENKGIRNIQTCQSITQQFTSYTLKWYIVRASCFDLHCVICRP